VHAPFASLSTTPNIHPEEVAHLEEEAVVRAPEDGFFLKMSYLFRM